MRFFFRSRQFKIILSVFSFLLVISLIFGIWGKKMSPHTDIAGMISAPFKTLATSISNGISDIVSSYKDNSELLVENAELTSKINDMREKTADYDKIISENESYKKYLGIKEKNLDLSFVIRYLFLKTTPTPTADLP